MKMQTDHFPAGITRRVCRPCRFVQDGRGARTDWNTSCPKCGEELVETTVHNRALPSVQQLADDAEFIRKMEEAETAARLDPDRSRLESDPLDHSA